MTESTVAPQPPETGARPDLTAEQDVALNPVRRPWGHYAPRGLLGAARAAAIATRGVPLVERWIYKLLTHFTRKRGIIADIEYAGLKWRTFLDENSHDRWLFRMGEHPEEDDFAIFTPFRGKGGVFVDIGANVGHFSLTAFREFQGKGRIIAFEPHPRTVRKLGLNLGFNGADDAVEVQNVALGATHDTLMLHTPFPDSDGGNSLAGERSTQGGVSVLVQVVPLAGTLMELGVDQIDILKIDVEGYEDRVLIPFFDQAPRQLWPREVLIELTFGDEQSYWLESPVERMLACGYREKARTRDNLWLELSPSPSSARDSE